MRYTPVVTGLSSGAVPKETPDMQGIIMPRILMDRPT
jgi:hypothetical protein